MPSSRPDLAECRRVPLLHHFGYSRHQDRLGLGYLLAVPAKEGTEEGKDLQKPLKEPLKFVRADSKEETLTLRTAFAREFSSLRVSCDAPRVSS